MAQGRKRQVWRRRKPRPQQLDVYIPITLPRSTDLPGCLERLQGAIESCTVALESSTEAGYVVGVRVFVAGEAEHRAVEQAIAAIARQEQDAQAHLTAATP